jgi:hypothetical protein
MMAFKNMVDQIATLSNSAWMDGNSVVVHFPTEHRKKELA